MEKTSEDCAARAAIKLQWMRIETTAALKELMSIATPYYSIARGPSSALFPNGRLEWRPGRPIPGQLRLPGLLARQALDTVAGVGNETVATQGYRRQDFINAVEWLMPRALVPPMFPRSDLEN